MYVCTRTVKFVNYSTLTVITVNTLVWWNCYRRRADICIQLRFQGIEIQVVKEQLRARGHLAHGGLRVRLRTLGIEPTSFGLGI